MQSTQPFVTKPLLSIQVRSPKARSLRVSVPQRCREPALPEVSRGRGQGEPRAEPQPALATSRRPADAGPQPHSGRILRKKKITTKQKFPKVCLILGNLNQTRSAALLSNYSGGHRPSPAGGKEQPHTPARLGCVSRPTTTLQSEPETLSHLLHTSLNLLQGAPTARASQQPFLKGFINIRTKSIQISSNYIKNRYL